MEEEQQEAKWGVPSIGIPAEVLFNPVLTLTEKMLFGFVRNLSATSRGCWATNKYLGNLIGVEKQTVSNALAKLKKYQYIEITFSKKVGWSERNIFIRKDYQVTYRPLVEAIHDSLLIQNNMPILTDLYTYINEIIDNKEDNKEDNKKGKSFSKEKDRDFPLSPRSDIDISLSEPPKKDRPTKQSLSPSRNGRYLSYEEAPASAREVVDYWNSFASLPTHGIHTKIVEGTLYHLDDKIMKRYSVELVKGVIKKIVEMQDNRSYTINKVSLDMLFLGNGYLKKPPLFAQLVMTDGYKVFLKKDLDKNPELTDMLKGLYQKHILGEEVGFGPKEESQLVLASTHLKECIGKGRLGEYVSGADDRDYILLLFTALEEAWGKGGFSIGNLCSNHTWNDLVPRTMSKYWEAD